LTFFAGKASNEAAAAVARTEVAIAIMKGFILHGFLVRSSVEYED
jgi:hypothetical protein